MPDFMKMIFKTHRQSRKEMMDCDLAGLRLWRKPIAKDDCSLYRAVSEQLFLCQVYHEEIRDKIMAFIEKNHEKLKSEWTTRIEFLAISLLFNCDIIVYQFGRPPIDLTLNNFDKKVHLCVSGGNHYDCVYPYSYKEVGAICQSILYDILYRAVFKVGDDVIKQGLDILHCKQYHRNKKFMDRGEPNFLPDGSINQRGRCSPRRDLPAHPPFPYRVAKALDPVIYRNVEYDNWVDTVKESASDLEPTFQMGDKCQVILEKEADKVYYAHIQDITLNKGPVTVFIEELGEKHTVDYENLRPVPQPEAYTSRRRGRRKDQYFGRPPVGGGMRHGEENIPEWEEHERSPPMDQDGYQRRGYFGRRHGNMNDQHENRSVENRAYEFRNHRRNGPDRQFKQDTFKEEHPTERFMYQNQMVQRDFSRPQEQQMEFLQTEPRMNNNDYPDNAAFLQNNGYQPPISCVPVTVNGNMPSLMPVPSSAPTTHFNPFVPPPPLSMSVPPPTYTNSPVSYPLSMYPYLVLPPVGGTMSPVNYTAGPSQDPSGNDLPISDPSTLRYFYNLGYECHRLSNIHLGHPPQGPPPNCLQHYSNGPMMIQGNQCPPPEEYWTECSELEMPPVLVHNDWNECVELQGCGPEFLIAQPPPNCAMGYQQVPSSPGGFVRLPTLGSSAPITIPALPPQVTATPMQPSTMPIIHGYQNRGLAPMHQC